MNDRSIFYLSVTLRNVIAILSFVFLAYAFHHWWISLFCLLFLSGFSYTYIPVQNTTDNIKNEDETVDEIVNNTLLDNRIQCDVCGEFLIVEDIQHAVHNEMKENGWRRVKVAEKWEDLCPICAEKFYNAKR